MSRFKSSPFIDGDLQVIRSRHHSVRTEDTYVHWIRSSIFHNRKQHPQKVGEETRGERATAGQRR